MRQRSTIRHDNNMKHQIISLSEHNKILLEYKAQNNILLRENVYYRDVMKHLKEKIKYRGNNRQLTFIELYQIIDETLEKRA